MPIPTTIPTAVERLIADEAVSAVMSVDDDYHSIAIARLSDLRDPAGRARLARYRAAHRVRESLDDLDLDPIARDKLRAGLSVLLDASERTAHDLTDAAIAEAAARAKCRCGPTFLAILRSLLSLGVEAGFAGLRRAGAL